MDKRQKYEEKIKEARREQEEARKATNTYIEQDRLGVASSYTTHMWNAQLKEKHYSTKLENLTNTNN